MSHMFAADVALNQPLNNWGISAHPVGIYFLKILLSGNGGQIVCGHHCKIKQVLITNMLSLRLLLGVSRSCFSRQDTFFNIII